MYSSKSTEEWVNLYIKEVVSKYNKSFCVKPKSKFWLFKLFGPIIKLINPDFFSTFITTMFGVMWVPDDWFKKTDKRNALMTVAHEGLHEYRRKKMFPGMFELAYAFPQILFIPFIALTVFHSIYWLIPALISLLPLPAWWRFKIEVEGYTTRTLWALYVNRVEIEEYDKATIFNLKSLRGGYYSPMPFERVIRSHIERPLEIEADPKYKDILRFLAKYELFKEEVQVTIKKGSDPVFDRSRLE